MLWTGSLAAILAAVAATFSFADFDGESRPAALPAVRTQPPPTRGSGHPLRLPGPIDGLVLIADRGNNRLLLVNGASRLVWRYPRAGCRPAYPFRFDDDAFFGPALRTIVSNQEEQDTIQIIGFPSGRILWHYGHVNARGSGAGYLNVPDDAYELFQALSRERAPA